MHIRRLGWAGLELTSDGTTIAIDLLEGLGVMEQFLGGPREPLPPPGRPLAGALVTHLHGDHADPEALARRLVPDAAPVLRPAPRIGAFRIGTVSPADRDHRAAGAGHTSGRDTALRRLGIGARGDVADQRGIVGAQDVDQLAATGAELDDRVRIGDQRRPPDRPVILPAAQRLERGLAHGAGVAANAPQSACICGARTASS